MKSEDIVEMFVAGLVMDPSSNAPIVILKDIKNSVCLPIWIGLAEATAIASALKRVELLRPMTHDLMQRVIERLNARISRVVITSLQESTFIANLEVADGDTIEIIDCRPSDAIALAVRVACPIYVASNVLAAAQVTLNGVSPEFGGSGPRDEDADEAHNFATIDKGKWSQILANMDPDDFKYKM